MAKYCGKIGYLLTGEIRPGVWAEGEIVERQYFGDIYKQNNRWESSGGVNDNVTLNQNVSIVADPFAFANAQNIRYAEFYGQFWSVTSVQIEYPRLVLTIGGIYNGETSETTRDSDTDSWK